AFGAGEIERAERLMNEHGPSAGADDERDGHAPAEGAQLISALAAAVVESLAAAIELGAALAESEDGRGAGVEGDERGFAVDGDLLHGFAGGILDGERKRVGSDVDGDAAGLYGLRAKGGAQLGDGSAPGGLNQRTIIS